MRHCIGDRSWASSTSTCAKVRGSSPSSAGRGVAAVSPRDLGRGDEAADTEIRHDTRGSVVAAAPPSPPASVASGLRRTQQRVGLVDEGEVGLGPRHVAHVGGPRPHAVVAAPPR